MFDTWTPENQLAHAISRLRTVMFSCELSQESRDRDVVGLALQQVEWVAKQLQSQGKLGELPHVDPAGV
ncbi:MAG: hypothetical protein JNL82_17375 [Myxococcales bacterium]|nr:hypothetical protein [Myxococcales bacterium]